MSRDSLSDSEPDLRLLLAALGGAGDRHFASLLEGNHTVFDCGDLLVAGLPLVAAGVRAVGHRGRQRDGVALLDVVGAERVTLLGIVGSLTVSVSVRFFFPTLKVIFVLPFALAVTMPLELTVATFFFEDLNFLPAVAPGLIWKVAPAFTVALARLPVQAICSTPEALCRACPERGLTQFRQRHSVYWL